MAGLSVRAKPFVEARVGAILEAAGWVKSKRKGEYFVSWETWNEVGLVLGLRVDRKLSTAERTVFHPDPHFGVRGYMPIMAGVPDSPLPFEMPFSLGSLIDVEGAFPQAPMELLGSIAIREPEVTGVDPAVDLERLERALREYLIPAAPRLEAKRVFEQYVFEDALMRTEGVRSPMVQIRTSIVLYLSGDHVASARALAEVEAMKPAEWESPWIRETIPPAMERLHAALVSVGAR